MEPIDKEELNAILPPMKEQIRTDIESLDGYLRNLKKEEMPDGIMASWDNVREAALSFTLIIGQPVKFSIENDTEERSGNR